MATYATPDELWRLGLPYESLFEEGGFEPGSITDPVLTGAGLGTLDLDQASNPRDAWTVTVLCTRTGEVDIPGVVNVGLLPQFRATLTQPGPPLVTVWTSRKLTPDANNLIKVPRAGLGITLANAESGAPVTIGVGNAALVFTPLISGCSVLIQVGAALGLSFYPGSAPPIAQGRMLTLTVTTTTTAAQAAAYVQGNAQVVDYLSCAPGGDGSGIVQAAALTTIPLSSFTAMDVWAFSTSPSPDLLACQQAAHDYMDGFLVGSFRLPLTQWGEDVKLCENVYARWFALVRRGLDKGQDFKIYDPAGPLKMAQWLEGVQNGNIRPQVTQQPPGNTLFPLLIDQIDPLDYRTRTWPPRDVFPI